MITVKKDAIMYKDSEGNMQSAGVLCNVGVIGESIFEKMTCLAYIFQTVDFSFCPDVVLNFPYFMGAQCNYMFHKTTNLRSVKLSCVVRDSPMTFGYFASDSKSLEVVDLSEFNTTFSNAISAFAFCVKLKTVLGVLDLSACTAVSHVINILRGCTSLEEITFKEECIKFNFSASDSPLLSDESIQSIIDGLADLTGQTAQVIAFHKDVKAKLTEEQKAQITSKNWTLA